MGIEETDTEFFGSSRRPSRPRRSERSRSKREQRRRLRPLGSPDPDERGRAAVDLVQNDLDHNATTLLDFVRDETEAEVRASVADALLTAPIGPDPNHPAAQLRDWAIVEMTRHGGTAAGVARPAAAPPIAGPAPVAPRGDSPPLSSPPPPAPAPLASGPLASGLPMAGVALSPDDRWRAGTVAVARPRPVGPHRSAPARPARPAPAPAPPPPAPPHPPVVGGTIGTPAAPRPGFTTPPAGNGAADLPAPEKPAVPTPTTPPPEIPNVEPMVELARSEPAAPTLLRTPSPTPAVSPAPAGEEPSRPATWRIVKASPVDIVVWEPAEPAE